MVVVSHPNTRPAHPRTGDLSEGLLCPFPLVPWPPEAEVRSWNSLQGQRRQLVLHMQSGLESKVLFSHLKIRSLIHREMLGTWNSAHLRMTGLGVSRSVHLCLPFVTLL